MSEPKKPAYRDLLEGTEIDLVDDGPGDTTRRPMPEWMIPAAKKLMEDLKRFQDERAAGKFDGDAQ